MSDDDTRHSGSRWEPTPASVPAKDVPAGDGGRPTRITAATTASRWDTPPSERPGARSGTGRRDRSPTASASCRPRTTRPGPGRSYCRRFPWAARLRPRRAAATSAAPGCSPLRRRGCSRWAGPGATRSDTPRPGATRQAPPVSRGRRASTATTAARSVRTAACRATGTATAPGRPRRRLGRHAAGRRPAPDRGAAVPAVPGRRRDHPARDAHRTARPGGRHPPRPRRRRGPADRRRRGRRRSGCSSRTGGSPAAASRTSRLGERPDLARPADRPGRLRPAAGAGAADGAASRAVERAVGQDRLAVLAPARRLHVVHPDARPHRADHLGLRRGRPRRGARRRSGTSPTTYPGMLLARRRHGCAW